MPHNVVKLAPYNIEYVCDTVDCNGNVLPATDLTLDERCGITSYYRHNCNKCKRTYGFSKLLPYLMWLKVGEEPNEQTLQDLSPLELTDG